MPAGIGIAHVGRLIMIAKELQKLQVEVIFGAGAEACKILKGENLPYRIIKEFPRNVYEEKIKKNNFFIYNRTNFTDFVKSEQALYKKVKPDLIVFDTRITAKVSATIAGIPLISVNNADATSYYDYQKCRFPLNTTIGRYLPGKVVRLLEREYGQKFLLKAAERAIPAMLIAAMVNIFPAFIKLRYKPSRDPFQFFQGDITLLADIPEFRPVKNLPENIKMVGPIFWDGVNKLPVWSKEIEERNNIIYVTASGTGDKQIFLQMLDFLKETDYTVIATTGNTLSPKEVTVSYPSLYLTDYLPGSYIMPRAQAVIFPGGNASCYQALSYGVPQIATPFHIDQEDNANQLERLGTGVIQNHFKNFDRKHFLETVDKVISNKSYRTKAGELKKIIANYNGKKTAARLIADFMS